MRAPFTRHVQDAGRGTEAAEADRRHALSDDPRLLTGEAILRAPRSVPPVWGSGSEVAWAKGEPAVIAGPPGLVKSTLAQHLMLARACIGPGELLRMAVAPDPTGRVLYVAADRPAQMLRSSRRMVDDADAPLLRERVKVWCGPLDADLGRHPELLAELAAAVGAGTVFLDSLGAVASRTSEDESGGGVSRAFALVAAAGVELFAVHHTRKSTNENKHPEKLDDVFGSRWISAGAGSVLGLFGPPGATRFDLRHLKMPAAVVARCAWSWKAG